MERESLLAVLIVLLSGVALHLFAAWPLAEPRAGAALELERSCWTRMWASLIPALLVVAGLCGWALSQPDPVPSRVGRFVFIATAPFGLVLLRALIRAAWSLRRGCEDHGVATVGLLKPRIVFAPDLAKLLDERSLEAALEHERAHVRHHDPLRIWVAQFVTDLQWPWSHARRRYAAWLAALECARDEEARAGGVDGADLAAAVIAAVRFHRGGDLRSGAGLIGPRTALEARVERLLNPLPTPPGDLGSSSIRIVGLLSLALLFALIVGVVFGERLIGPLLALSA